MCFSYSSSQQLIFFFEFVILILWDRFEKAISSQPITDVLCNDHVQICGSLLILTGTVLVLSSFLSLGILGTFLGVVNMFLSQFISSLSPVPIQRSLL